MYSFICEQRAFVAIFLVRRWLQRLLTYMLLGIVWFSIESTLISVWGGGVIKRFVGLLFCRDSFFWIRPCRFEVPNGNNFDATFTTSNLGKKSKDVHCRKPKESFAGTIEGWVYALATTCFMHTCGSGCRCEKYPSRRLPTNSPCELYRTSVAVRSEQPRADYSKYTVRIVALSQLPIFAVLYLSMLAI